MRPFVQWISLAVLTVAILSGCGEGDESPTTSNATGVFADAPVQGVRYVFGNYSGFTGVGGTFSYPVGMHGTFRVGDIVIGTVTGSPLITVVDLVKARHPEYTDQEAQSAALSIVRFMTSIGGGHDQWLLDIQQDISDAAKGEDFKSVDLLSLSDQELQTLIDRLGTFVLTTSEEAQAHQERTLANVSLLPHVGTYITENWNGDAFVEVFVSPDGYLYGVGTNASGETIALRGSVLSSGGVSLEISRRDQMKKTLSRAASPVSLSTGTSDGRGTITGTVQENGTFSEKSFPFSLRRIANPHDSYTGLYRGWLTGADMEASFTLGVGTDGKVVGWAGDYLEVAPISGKVNLLSGAFSLPCGNGTLTGTLSGGMVAGTYSGKGDVTLELEGNRMYLGDPR